MCLLRDDDEQFRNDKMQIKTNKLKFFKTETVHRLVDTGNSDQWSTDYLLVIAVIHSMIHPIHQLQSQFPLLMNQLD